MIRIISTISLAILAVCVFGIISETSSTPFFSALRSALPVECTLRPRPRAEGFVTCAAYFQEWFYNGVTCSRQGYSGCSSVGGFSTEVECTTLCADADIQW